MLFVQNRKIDFFYLFISNLKNITSDGFILFKLIIRKGEVCMLGRKFVKKTAD
ncbi:hypothetical protein TPE_0065 [Treponema pedis str. T A4]|uniref:Uncharacterized protein n=1 Tax=Treponema pedis str. T A4 TaxID=1291379 RepID=S5ZX64_9SPIR|nr:hypothetical protein TPE_0065 [Treponema pedis str. T A4]